jgi:hypothetical protein
LDIRINGKRLSEDVRGMKVKSVSTDELNKEDFRYIHFSITKEGYFRCGEGEDKFGKDCTFKVYKSLAALGLHYENHHLRERK